MARLRARLNRALRNRRGAVSVIGALVLPLLVGMTGLVAEYGNGVLAKTQDQRVADIAAYAGALAYNTTSSTTTMGSVVTYVGGLNSLSGAQISGSVVNSPTGDGNQAVKVVVNTTVPLILSRVLGTSATLPVSATAYAELKPNAKGCIIALGQNGTGVTLSNSSEITADACAVDSNATVGVPCGNTITTVLVNYDSSAAPSDPCTGIQGPSGQSVRIRKQLTADPYAGNTGVATANARVNSVAALSSPAAPSVSAGGDISFAKNAGSTAAQASADGCSASESGTTWTVTCPSGGTYNFGNVSVSGGATVNFNTTGSASTTYNFSGAVTAQNSSNLTFGPGNFNIAQGVSMSNSSNVTFGAGTFNIGPGSSTCQDGGVYSLCAQSGTVATFGGPSSFTLAAGVYAGSNANVILGSGSTNSFNIGSSNNGNALMTSSGSNTIFGDATGVSSIFQMIGSVNAVGSACIAIGNAAQHDINGPVIEGSSSNMTIGAGVYTVADYFDGESSSGGAGCLGASAGTSGSGVTYVIGARTTPSTGNCATLAICVLSDSSAALIAPTTGPTAGFTVIGPTSSSNTAGAYFSASTGSFGGVFYMPNGPITVTHSSVLGGDGSQCLELIGSQVTVASSSGISSTCAGSTAASTSVLLVE